MFLGLHGNVTLISNRKHPKRFGERKPETTRNNPKNNTKLGQNNLGLLEVSTKTVGWWSKVLVCFPRFGL